MNNCNTKKVKSPRLQAVNCPCPCIYNGNKSNSTASTSSNKNLSADKSEKLSGISSRVAELQRMVLENQKFLASVEQNRSSNSEKARSVQKSSNSANSSSKVINKNTFSNKENNPPTAGSSYSKSSLKSTCSSQRNGSNLKKNQLVNENATDKSHKSKTSVSVFSSTKISKNSSSSNQNGSSKTNYSSEKNKIMEHSAMYAGERADQNLSEFSKVSSIQNLSGKDLIIFSSNNSSLRPPNVTQSSHLSGISNYASRRQNIPSDDEIMIEEQSLQIPPNMSRSRSLPPIYETNLNSKSSISKSGSALKVPDNFSTSRHSHKSTPNISVPYTSNRPQGELIASNTLVRAPSMTIDLKKNVSKPERKQSGAENSSSYNSSNSSNSSNTSSSSSSSSSGNSSTNNFKTNQAKPKMKFTFNFDLEAMTTNKEQASSNTAKFTFAAEQWQ